MLSELSREVFLNDVGCRKGVKKEWFGVGT